MMRDWTPDETSLAQALRRAGQTYRQIAAHFPGRTGKGVKRRLQYVEEMS